MAEKAYIEVVHNDAGVSRKERREVQPPAENADLTPVHSEGYLVGLSMSYVSATTVRIGAGCCRSSDNGLDIDSAGDLDADISASGAGGLDTGTETADTFYAVHIIGDSTGVNTPKALLSLSDTAPTMPSGYDKFRRCGWVGNAATSDIANFYQCGTGLSRLIRYNLNMESPGELTLLGSGGATDWTALDCSGFVPVGTQIIHLHIEGNGKHFWVSQDGNDVNFARGLSSQPIIYDIPLSADLKIQYMNDSGGPAGETRIIVLGYYDEL